MTYAEKLKYWIQLSSACLVVTETTTTDGCDSIPLVHVHLQGYCPVTHQVVDFQHERETREEAMSSLFNSMKSILTNPMFSAILRGRSGGKEGRCV